MFYLQGKRKEEKESLYANNLQNAERAMDAKLREGEED
jgi:hypothetical protein